jgi:hypothetical protein
MNWNVVVTFSQKLVVYRGFDIDDRLIEYIHLGSVVAVHRGDLLVGEVHRARHQLKGLAHPPSKAASFNTVGTSFRNRIFGVKETASSEI